MYRALLLHWAHVLTSRVCFLCSPQLLRVEHPAANYTKGQAWLNKFDLSISSVHTFFLHSCCAWSTLLPSTRKCTAAPWRWTASRTRPSSLTGRGVRGTALHTIKNGGAYAFGRTSSGAWLPCTGGLAHGVKMAAAAAAA